MDNFNNFDKLGKKNAFGIFLKIADTFNIRFNNSNYLNMASFQYFYQTDILKDKKEILDSFEYKISLPAAYGTLKNIINDRVSFYFAIKDSKLEYGFFDVDKEMLYKVGQFVVKSLDVKKLENRCLISIKQALKNTNIKNLTSLHKVKKSFKNLFKGYDSQVTILDEFRMRNTYDASIFKREDLDQNRMNSFIDNWLKTNGLYKKFVTHATVTEDKVNFYISVKEIKKRTFNVITNKFN